VIGRTVTLTSNDIETCHTWAKQYIAVWRGVPDARRVNRKVSKIKTVAQGYMGEVAFQKLFTKAVRQGDPVKDRADDGLDFVLNGLPIDVKTMTTEPPAGHLVVEEKAGRKSTAHYACMYLHEGPAGVKVTFCGFFSKDDLLSGEHRHPKYPGFWVKCAKLYEFRKLLDKAEA
jgi:hypothetical protein